MQLYRGKNKHCSLRDSDAVSRSMFGMHRSVYEEWGTALKPHFHYPFLQVPLGRSWCKRDQEKPRHASCFHKSHQVGSASKSLKIPRSLSKSTANCADRSCAEVDTPSPAASVGMLPGRQDTACSPDAHTGGIPAAQRHIGEIPRV